MPGKEVEILPLIYDLILWYSPKISQYPKKYKFTLGDRITNVQLSILERIIESKYTSGAKKKHFLRQANLLLEKLRFLIRLSKDLHEIGLKKFVQANITNTQ